VLSLDDIEGILETLLAHAAPVERVVQRAEAG